MAELTEEQAREALSGLSNEELLALAAEKGLPYSEDKEQIINMLLGKCGGCKGNKSNITLTVIPRSGRAKTIINKKQETAPCVGCNK